MEGKNKKALFLKQGVFMSGNTSVLPQILGASTVAGTAAVVLPTTGGNSVFSLILIGVIAVAAIVVVTRLIKIFATRSN